MPGAVLSGELGLIGLFDLAQLLMLNGASGELVITRDGRRGCFYFDHGQITNAVDDDYRDGEGAAIRLFAWKVGAYAFTPGPPSGARAIEESTEGLMLEAARRLDEAGAESGASETDRLRQRAGAFDALRDAFQSLARETRAAFDPAAAGDSPFAQLHDASDALLLRPGQRPRVQQAGRWRDADSVATDAAAFEQLRAKLLEGAPAAGGTPGAASRLVLHENGRRYAITHVAAPEEALWVRPALQDAAGDEGLEGSLDVLGGLLAAESGLVLVGAAEAEVADALLHACVARLARTRPAALLLVADHDRWHHPEHAGVLLRASEADAPALLRALLPGVAAFDVARAGKSTGALGLSPLVLAAVVAPEPGALLSRWCARIGRRWGDGIEAALAGSPIGAVFGSRAGTCLRFEASRIGLDGASAPIAAPTPAPVAAAGTASTAGRAAKGTAAAARPSPAAATPAPPSVPPGDPMAALAAELGRTLRKSA